MTRGHTNRASHGHAFEVAIGKPFPLTDSITRESVGINKGQISKRAEHLGSTELHAPLECETEYLGLFL